MPLINALLRAVLLAILAQVCLVGAARADLIDCGLFSPETSVALARVATTESRLNFVAGADARRPNCPSTATDCTLNAYLVPGDEVLVAEADGPYLCATFKSQRGVETSGWLPRTALQIAPTSPAPASGWAGTWRRDRDATIVLKSGRDGVAVTGSASFGGDDPDKVKRGAVQSGELDGTGRPRGHTLALGYDPAQAVHSAPEDVSREACAARLRLFGRYLIVEDNRGCGGVNVSFTGLYLRASRE